MLEEQKQKYGIYIPQLKTFMYIQTTRQQFDQILASLDLENKTPTVSHQFGADQEIGSFTDFDYVIK